MFAASKQVTDNFSQVQFMMHSGDVAQAAQAMDRLRVMFEIIDCIEGSQCHELEDISDHIRRVFDLLLSSQACEFFEFVLKQEDTIEIAQMKVDVLKIVCLMTYGNKYFTQGKFPKFDQTSDGLLG